jgi:D-alanine transaminase
MSVIVYLNGSYLPKEEARISPEDRGFLFADGIYEVARAYGGSFFALDAHLQRMARGLAALAIEGFDATDASEISHELLQRNGFTGKDAIVYLQITRGVAPRTHFFPDPPVSPTVFAMVNPLHSRWDPRKGVGVIVAPDQRWTRCDIKSVSLLPNCLAAEAARAAGVAEALLIRDGVVMEGTHTSVFGVFDGEVRTAPASNYILPSITRQVVLDLCAEHGIPHGTEPFFAHDLARADELFLAGTTMEVMPIVRVDDQPVGSGTPGPFAQRLLHLFHGLTQ